MKIELKCTCGASIVLDDPERSFINSGGYLDEKGRKYFIQREADKWLDIHNECNKNIRKTE